MLVSFLSVISAALKNNPETTSGQFGRKDTCQLGGTWKAAGKGLENERGNNGISTVGNWLVADGRRG